ncbi:MAG TPA: 50S ribosomal protein L3 N(5)-glutamine methyltransferase [Burkholderiales bacterium]
MPRERIAGPRTVRGAVRWAQRALAAAGVYCGHGTDNARDEAAWLVSGALGIAPHALAACADRRLEAEARARLRELVAARIETRKPTAYLLREAWFAGLPFYVDERVIVPRSLTAEVVAEGFAPWIDPGRVQRILDLCTGSGCIAIAAAIALPHALVDGADVSADALAVARINVERHGVGARVRLAQSDLFETLAGLRYDVIVSNPPYVAHHELETLPAEYRHEPRLALAAGDDGLDVVLRILRDAPDHLTAGGILIVEVGNSRETLERALPRVPFVWLATTSGDECVFLLTAAELERCRSSVAEVLAQRAVQRT